MRQGCERCAGDADQPAGHSADRVGRVLDAAASVGPARAGGKTYSTTTFVDVRRTPGTAWIFETTAVPRALTSGASIRAITS